MTLLDLYPDGSYSVFEDVDGDTFSLRMRGFVIGVKEDLLNYSWEMYSGRKYRITDVDCRKCCYCMYEYGRAFPEIQVDGHWMPTVLFCRYSGDVLSFDFMRIRQKVNRPCRNYKLDEDAGW
jgi:hypothetical protein